MIATKQKASEKLKAEKAVHFVKSCFEHHLSEHLPLTKVSAPAIVLQGTGINDDLSGIERPVNFPIKAMEERSAEVVQSLAKWKRLQLKEYELPPGTGIYTDMKALRPDEDLGRLHSIYVDQWDWEMVIQPKDRHLAFLKLQVKKIYQAIRRTELQLAEKYPGMQPFLPGEITFLHAEELLEKYPHLTAKQRENKVAEDFGAVFLIGIGGELSNGEFHDGRAPDYDDWSTPTSASTKGLNGDILFWNPILEQAFEISSMGIRVDPAALKHQLKVRKARDKAKLHYHRQLLQGELPETIGGGIGQSRLCMFLLKKRHIGEVQVSIWPTGMREECQSQGIHLL